MAREYVLQEFRRDSELQIRYQEELNPQQYEAATAPPGPALVLAGAGSGKTRTLTYRVAYLIEHGVPADRILLLTFTNKAAREMMRRVSDLLGSEMSQLWGGTFHSIGARILRTNAELLGYRRDFSILDRDDAEALLKTCIGTMSQEKPAGWFPKAEVLADLISRALNERRRVSDLVDRDFKWGAPAAEIEALAAAYAERKRAINAMDFDDLLSLWLQAMEEREDFRERYQDRFQWILVDEYQDTNKIQSDLVDLLAAGHRNLMAVGDDSQSIYSWRGANFRNILDFPKRYPEARIFKIETNYRSTPEILAVANAAITANTAQFTKELVPARRSGMKPALVACEDGNQQAAFVAQRVRELQEEGIDLREMAVLYRSHFHALELQLELTARGIPFVITSGIRFFEQAHVKDVSAWLKMLVNPDDELAFKRLVLLLPGIGPKAAEKLWTAFRATPAPGPADGESPETPVPRLAIRLQGIRAKVPKKAEVAWAQIAATVAQLEVPPAAGHPDRMIRLVLEAFYEDYAQKAFPNPGARLEDLEQLAVYAAQFSSVSDFLTQLSLLTHVEAEADQRPVSADDDRLRLSTVHQAKGLEFQVVFVIMLGDGLFPSMRSLNHPDAEEEERRLFYVAITRAKDELYLIYPLLRFAPGQGTSMIRRSRFLGEIPPSLLEEWNLRTSSWHGAYLEAPEGEEGDEPF
jgi:DNA helicase-2/ATP-dependent DNA helicase PcrA